MSERRPFVRLEARKTSFFKIDFGGPMRMFSIVFAALLSTAQAELAAQDTLRRPEFSPNRICYYTVRGYPQEVPAGANLCWRSPSPYSSEYGLLYCDPKLLFQEIALVRRGDRRCDRYEYRQ